MKYKITVDEDMLQALAEDGYFADIEKDDRLLYGEEDKSHIEFINRQVGRFWYEVEKARRKSIEGGAE